MQKRSHIIKFPAEQFPQSGGEVCSVLLGSDLQELPSLYLRTGVTILLAVIPIPSSSPLICLMLQTSSSMI